jgi:hypothetical protein
VADAIAVRYTRLLTIMKIPITERILKTYPQMIKIRADETS